MHASTPIKIALTGDLCPTGRIEDLCKSNKLDNIFGDVLPLLKNSDLSITNLECPLTKDLDPIVKLGPTLSANPECIEILKLAGFGVAALANNHIMDQGEIGLQSTIMTCKQAGIKTVGVGADLKKAREPLYVDVKGHTVAIINCAENEFSIAGSQQSGANPLDPIQIYYTVMKAKERTNTILVIVHGGHEFYEYPSARMVDAYRFIADMGVTAVIAHHTHCVSGYEWRNGVPIIYSLGNFLFDRRGSYIEGWNEGILAMLHISDDKVKELVLYPFYQCRNKVTLELMTGKSKDKFIAKVNEIGVTISNQEELERKWNSFLEKKEMEYMPPLLTMGKYRRYLFKRGLDLLGSAEQKKLLYLLNLIRCEAHRDVSTAVLRKWIEKGR